MSVNSFGQVTGSYVDTYRTPHALFYNPATPGSTYDLNSLVDPKTPLPVGVTLVQGTAINDNGWIVAEGNNDHAYLLQPTGGPTPCHPFGSYTFCNLHYHETLCPGHSWCVFKCRAPCENTVVSWIPPIIDDGHGGDPWLNGVSVKTGAETWEQARNIGANLQVEVSTEPKVQSVSERTVSAEMISEGTLKLSRVTIVSSVVDVSAVPSESRTARELGNSEVNRTMEISLPYVSSTASEGADLRMVQFDQTNMLGVEYTGGRCSFQAVRVFLNWTVVWASPGVPSGTGLAML